MVLSPLEEFKLLKEGKLPTKEKQKRPLSRPEAYSPNDSPVDSDSKNEGTGEPHPKKLGEACSHPADRISTAHGGLVGTIHVCLDCGRVVNDRDLQA